MLQLLHKAQELSGWEECLYIDENLHSMFNKAYQDALSSINEHPLLITKQEIKKCRCYTMQHWKLVMVLGIPMKI